MSFDFVLICLCVLYVLFDLEQFLLYWLSVLFNWVSGNIVKLYGDCYGLVIFEWWVIIILVLYLGFLVSEVFDCMVMDKVVVSCVVVCLLECGFIKCEMYGDDCCCLVLVLLVVGFEVYEIIVLMVIEIICKLMLVLSEEEEQVLEKLILCLVGEGLEWMG